MTDESRPSKRANGSAETARPRRTKSGHATATGVVVEAPRSGVVIDEDGIALDPNRVELRRSAVGRVDSGSLEVQQGAIGAARADHVTVDQGAVGAAMADHVEISRGYARSILSRQVQLDRAAARVVVAADVRADRSAVMFLVARKVEGNVRVLFDWRGAIAFGAVAGLVLALLRRGRGASSKD
jgi:hypothetical protein